MIKINKDVSIVIPAKNEAESLKSLLPRLLSVAEADQIYVVNDGSTDQTERLCREFGVHVENHSSSRGNGAAIKSGARAADGKTLVFMDADGQHDPKEIQGLLDLMDEGADMVVGARGSKSQASLARLFANSFYNSFASWMTGFKIEDLTSGFRVVNAERFREFLYLLPNGFSYPTTITMAFMRAGYSVRYKEVPVAARIGKSHIQIGRDGVRFLMIIFKIGTLYSPLKIFLPLSFFFFLLGSGYYAYTFSTFGTFTNMAALLYVTSLLIFLIGLVSEQISALTFKGD